MASCSTGAEQSGAAVRLLHVVTVPMTLGFLTGQVGYLKERGFEVHVLSSPGTELERFGECEGVSVHAVEMTRRISPLHDLRAVRQIYRLLRHLRPQILHSSTPKGGLLGMIAAWLARIPIRLYQIRGLPYLTASGWKRQLLRSAERVACRIAHRVIAVSHSMCDIVIADGICPPDKVEVLAGGSSNGVDAAGRFDPDAGGTYVREEMRAELGIPREAVVLGFVGRVTNDKGVRELVAAWERLRDRVPDPHLVIVGPFESQDPIPVAARRALEEDSRVHLTGLQEEISRFYAAMDIVVLPTYREGFPNVPLEAAAMRRPIVATRVPGCTDAVQDGTTGILVPVRDSRALAAAIRTYIENPALRRRHGRAGRKRTLREFRPEDIWEGLYQQYCSLMRDRWPVQARPEKR